MKTYTPKEVEQLLKEQREICAYEAHDRCSKIEHEDIENAPLPSSFTKLKAREKIVPCHNYRPNSFSGICQTCGQGHYVVLKSEEVEGVAAEQFLESKGCLNLAINDWLSKGIEPVSVATIMEEYAASYTPKQISEEEIQEMARDADELQNYDLAEAEIFMDGYVAGYKEAITKQ